MARSDLQLKIEFAQIKSLIASFTNRLGPVYRIAAIKGEYHNFGGSILSMNLAEQIRVRRGGLRWVLETLLIALLAFGAARLVRPAEFQHDSAFPKPSTPDYAEDASVAAHDPLRQTNFLLDFAGDHSVNAATVTEKAAEGRALYTVDLRLASGAEQSVEVTGPPGGLHIEMDDMTGDHVPNDLILRPALFSWLPTVLVNDGHNHFSVVVSGTDSGSCSAPENLGSAPHSGQTFAFLRSSGFKAFHAPAGKRILAPQLRQALLSSFEQSFAHRAKRGSRPDRAPPAATRV